MHRRQNLCSILRHSKGTRATEQLCRYFNAEHTQPYKKNLILDVVSDVARQLPLKDLVGLAKTAFNIILRDDGAIQAQDPAVKGKSF